LEIKTPIWVKAEVPVEALQQLDIRVGKFKAMKETGISKSYSLPLHFLDRRGASK
jgi:hypothetical protein